MGGGCAGKPGGESQCDVDLRLHALPVTRALEAARSYLDGVIETGGYVMDIKYFSIFFPLFAR